MSETEQPAGVEPQPEERFGEEPEPVQEDDEADADGDDGG